MKRERRIEEEIKRKNEKGEIGEEEDKRKKRGERV